MSNASPLEWSWVIGLSLAACGRLYMIARTYADARYAEVEQVRFGFSEPEVMKAWDAFHDELERATVLLLLDSFGIIAVFSPATHPGPPSRLSIIFTVILLLVALINVFSTFRAVFARRRLQHALHLRRQLRKRVTDLNPLPVVITAQIDAAKKDTL